MLRMVRIIAPGVPHPWADFLALPTTRQPIDQLHLHERTGRTSTARVLHFLFGRTIISQWKGEQVMIRTADKPMAKEERFIVSPRGAGKWEK